MSMGAERASAQPHDGTEYAVPQDFDILQESDVYQPEGHEEPADPPPSRGRKALGVALIVLALAWVAASAFAIYEARPAINLAAMLTWVATISVPLILLGLVWLIFGRSSRRETERFTQAVAALRAESTALESVLAIVTARLEENQARLSDEAARLMALGDEASDRLGRVTHYLSKQSAELDRKAQALDSAAASARVDVGVLLQDLPRAEEQARAAAAAMREAGLHAHEQAGALEGQLAALAAQGRDANESVGGAAQRLGAHLARIETSAGAASARLEESATAVNAAVDGALARAAEAVEASRAGLDSQASLMLAAIEQSRAAFEQAGAEAGRAAAERLEEIGTRLETVTAQLAEQDRASHALLASLAQEVGAVEQRFAQLGESGSYNAGRLGEAIGGVRNALQELHLDVQTGHQGAGELVERSQQLGEELRTLLVQLSGELPQALAGAEEHAARTGEATRSIVPDVEAVQASAGAAAASIAEAEASIARQREALAALLASVDEGAAKAEEQLRALGAAAGEADGEARRLVAETGPELIDALVRVREAAGQAANHAREAIAAVIPQSVAQLGEASRDAVSEAVTEPVQEKLAQLSLASENAVSAARRASERLTRQLLAIGETAAAIEARIEEERAVREEQEAEGFSRRVALLIESLNSTAIDVTKILSNEVTDSAWAAYLKGDRGVFTRRAVRLLESGEAREILRHYEEEPEFREQVNRYIHDFEAMLRRVLADKDGSPLSITLLSSDMGKLYVALAQAIERLRG